jgi:Cu-processing system permease protein
MGTWVMAGITFREAARKKILWTALGAGLGFLALFAIALHFQIRDFDARSTSPFIRYQILSAMLMVVSMWLICSPSS